MVKRFWIWDLGFWIDPDHKGTLLKDFGLNLKSKILRSLQGIETT
jgi:hypothetical protein